MEEVNMKRDRADEDGHSQEHSHQEHEPHHHHHGHGSHHHEEPMSQEEVLNSLLLLGQVALNAEDYESAVEAYASVLQLEPNETALYNLGSFRARGLGVKQDFMEGARLFHQAELLGNEQAGKLCAKCMFDYAHGDFESKTPADLYAMMAVFVSRVYPEAVEPKQEVSRGLFAIAGTHYNRGEYAEAAKFFRAAAEFGSDGYAQYYLATLYGAGAGVEKNDLAALYWLDCAVDNGAAEIARGDRDGLLDACRQGLSASEFHEMMATLATWCEAGTPDIPTNPDKATRWREVM